MGRFTGVLGIATIWVSPTYFPPVANPFDSRPFLGNRSSISSRPFCFARQIGRVAIPKLGNGAKRLLDFSYVGSSFVFGELGKDHSSLGLIFAFQGLAYHHFHRCVFCRPLSPWRDANHHSRRSLVNDRHHGRQRC